MVFMFFYSEVEGTIDKKCADNTYRLQSHDTYILLAIES